MTAAPPPSSPPSSPPPPWNPPAWETAPPPPPPPPAARPALRRSTTDRMVGGVAGGLAEYSGIDALLWRVGFVALALMGPGIPVYLLLWLVTPSGPGDQGAGWQGWGSSRSGSQHAGDLQPQSWTGRPPRSPIPRITVAGLLIAVGVLVLLTRLTGWDLGPRGFLGTALLVVGFGLVATAFTERHRGRGALITLGVLLSAALAVVSSTPWHVSGGVGDRSYHPVSADAVRSTYDGGVGNLTVDLGAVDLVGASTPIRTHVDGGVGNLHVVVPESADVELSVDSGLGNVDVFGHGSADGFFPGSGSASWTGDGRPEFVISIDAGIGNVEVSRG